MLKMMIVLSTYISYFSTKVYVAFIAKIAVALIELDHIQNGQTHMWELIETSYAARFIFRAPGENSQVVPEWPQVATCNWL